LQTTSFHLLQYLEQSMSMISRSRLTIAPQPAHEHLPHTQPAYAVSHTADARHMALGGAQRRMEDSFSATVIARHLLTGATCALCTPAHLTVAPARTWRWCSKLISNRLRRVVPLAREPSETAHCAHPLGRHLGAPPELEGGEHSKAAHCSHTVRCRS
jgi:hypothetical protein